VDVEDVEASQSPNSLEGRELVAAEVEDAERLGERADATQRPEGVLVEVQKDERRIHLQ
jgi:hypothetical protein